MRVVFLGTGEIAIPTFRALLASEHEVVALVTQPDKPVGRRSEPQPPAIKVAAQENGIAVLQPEKVKAQDALAELSALAPEVIVVMAYGQILPQELIDMPTKAIINLHASLLPKYRGASCIQSAIANGDEETGWTVMHVVKALDAGDIIEVQLLPISREETGESLHDRLAESGPASLTSALTQLEAGTATRLPQEEEKMTYAPKLEREHGRIDWSRPAEELERLIRAYHTWPGTFTTFVDGKGKERRLKVFPQVEVVARSGVPGEILVDEGRDGLLVACGANALALGGVQPEGSKRMSSAEFSRGVEVSSLGERP